MAVFTSPGALLLQGWDKRGFSVSGGLDSREQSWEIIVDRIEPDEKHGKITSFFLFFYLILSEICQ